MLVEPACLLIMTILFIFVAALFFPYFFSKLWFHNIKQNIFILCILKTLILSASSFVNLPFMVYTTDNC